MPKVGTLGLDMMYRTCTVQANLDFSSEADMVKKLRVSLALQPVATALFANSPFTEGKPNGFLSFRSEIWSDTDNAPLRHAAFRVRRRHGLRALCRLRARRADVFHQARRQIYRRRRQVVPRFFRRQAAGLPGERADACPTGPITSEHDLPGGAAQALSRNARRRRRAVAAACRRCRPSGSGCSTTTTRSMPAGTWSRAGARPSGRSCATTCRGLALPPKIRGRNVLDAGAARRCALPTRGLSGAAAARPRRPRRDALSAAARGNRSRAARRRPRNCWRNSTARGGSVEPVFEEYAY